jgi:DNA-binding transcriptional ArsR family regulator
MTGQVVSHAGSRPDTWALELRDEGGAMPANSGSTVMDDPAGTRTLRSSAKEACALLSVLAHEDRLVLLCHIAHDEHSVGELEELLDIHQPTLSQQLGVLRREGLVQTRREGKKIYYQLKSKEALAIIDSLHVQFCSRNPAAETI